MRRERPYSPGGGADARDPGIRTILFTDIVDSTTLTQSLGDEAAMALLGVHDTIVRDALSALGGREVKHTGDGIMASFVRRRARFDAQFRFSANWTSTRKRTPSVRSRFESAPQQANPSNNITICLDRQFNWPAGLCDHAQPEQILVSNAIAELCIGKGLRFEDLGEVALKGFGSPVRAHAAAWKQ